LINPRIFKKGTRKKWIPSFFLFLNLILK
jgi:hypothetical protein